MDKLQGIVPEEPAVAAELHDSWPRKETILLGIIFGVFLYEN